MRLAQWIICAVGVAVLGYGPDSEARRIKCWTNDQGIRECGNVVPPKYQQKGHVEINKQGIQVREQQRAKTPEELETERRQAEEARKNKMEADRLAKIQAEKDRVLLDTFTSEEDLLLAHRGRLAAIDSRIHHRRQILNDTEIDLKAARSKAASQERSGQPVGESLKEEIDAGVKQIADNKAFIAARFQEKVDLEKQFQKDLARYRELKGTSEGG
jgi:hypothetical protein